MGLYIALNRTPNIDCYWVGAVPNPKIMAQTRPFLAPPLLEDALSLHQVGRLFNSLPRGLGFRVGGPGFWGLGLRVWDLGLGGNNLDLTHVRYTLQPQHGLKNQGNLAPRSITQTLGSTIHKGS